MKDFAKDPETFEWLGVTYRIMLPTEATDGRMSVCELVAPVGFGPPRHRHHNEDETFIVLTGEIEVWMDGISRIVGPGESAFAPRGSEHTYRVIGDRPSRHLVVLTPGGFEGFFREMAAAHCRIPEDMPAVLASAARHALDFTGPPLGHEG